MLFLCTFRINYRDVQKCLNIMKKKFLHVDSYRPTSWVGWDISARRERQRKRENSFKQHASAPLNYGCKKSSNKFFPLIASLSLLPTVKYITSEVVKIFRRTNRPYSSIRALAITTETYKSLEYFLRAIKQKLTFHQHITNLKRKKTLRPALFIFICLLSP